MLHWLFPYRALLANAVSIFHTILSAWYLVGWLPWIQGRTKSWGNSYVMIYLSSLAAMLFVNLVFGYCPLTALEKFLESGGAVNFKLGPGFIVGALNRIGLHPPEGLFMIGGWVLFVLLASIFSAESLICHSGKKL